LPEHLARHARVIQREYLAIAKAGRPGAEIKAVARLEALIAMYSETSERLGLLDGRYKQLANEAAAGSWTRRSAATRGE